MILSPRFDSVRHRIDGLESLTRLLKIKDCVRHRIDGLETNRRSV